MKHLLTLSWLTVTSHMIHSATAAGFLGTGIATTSSSQRGGTSFLRMSSSQGFQKVKVLALHGSEGNGLHFSTSLYPLRDLLQLECQVDLQITAPSAPFPKAKGYAWWTMPQGVRSFTADEYIGFQQSADLVLSRLDSCDLVVAHSQGAILVAALLAQQQIKASPKCGYILNGVAWPNPFGQELFDLKLDTSPRVLFVMGQKDTINPLSSALQVKDRLEGAGCDVSVHTHAAGHSIPDDDASLKAMADWIVKAL